MADCAARPTCSALRSQQGLLLPSVENALQRYLADEQLWPLPTPPAVPVSQTKTNGVAALVEALLPQHREVV